MKKLIALSLALLLFMSFAPSVLAAHVHQWTQYSRVEPTCTQPGRVVYVCSCGTRKTESIPAPGHIYSNKVYINYADCTHYGSFYWVCERCGAHSDTGNDKPLGHDWGEWQVTVPATQSADGTEERVCARCGEKETRALACDPDAGRPVTYDNGSDASEILNKLRDDPPYTWDPDDPLRIVLQPVGGYITYEYGDIINLTVKAEGGVKPYTYQWRVYLPWLDYLGWTEMMPMVGTDSPQLTVSEGGKDYFCTVTDAAGNSVASRPATVSSEFAIVEQPTNANINGRESVTFSCRAIGGVPFDSECGYMYCWYKENGDFVDLNDGEVTVYEQGEYYCIVEDFEGNQITSETCKAYMGPQLDLSLTKDIISLAKGEPYTATARISGGTGPYTAEWTLGGSPLATELDGLAVTTSIKGREGEDYEYVCTVTDAMGETRRISLYDLKLQIMEQPEGGKLSDDPDDPFQLHVVIRASSAAAPYTYTLRKEGVDVRSEESYQKTCAFPITEPGLYTIYVEDSQGHETESFPAIVTDRVRIKSSISKAYIPFLGQSAKLEVEAEGGEGPYTYEWIKWGWNRNFEDAYPEYVMSSEHVITENGRFTVTEPFTYWICRVTDNNNDTATTPEMGVGLSDPSLLITVQPKDMEINYSVRKNPVEYLACQAAGNPGAKLSYTWQYKGDNGWRDVGEDEILKVGGEKDKRETLGIYRCKVTDEKTGRFEYSREAVVSAKFGFTRALQIGNSGRLEFEFVGGEWPYKVEVYQGAYRYHGFRTFVATLFDDAYEVVKYDSYNAYATEFGAVIILENATLYHNDICNSLPFWQAERRKTQCSYYVIVTDKHGNKAISQWVKCKW